jgi:rRNA maturation RNase YbeY
MPVTVLARHHVPGVSRALVRQQAHHLLRLLGETRSELTVSLVRDTEMQRLNTSYRGEDQPTDVLSFSMREGVPVAGAEHLLGDVVISLDTAERQARTHKVTVADEVTALLIHGLLHLLGYDHERSPQDARRMRRKERELRKALA